MGNRSAFIARNSVERLYIEDKRLTTQRPDAIFYYALHRFSKAEPQKPPYYQAHREIKQPEG